MSGMGTDIRKKMVAGGALACALALALACTVPVGTAHAEYLPEGSGEFDVSMVTKVLPVVDPDAQLSDVVIHVANDAGAHVEAAQVEIVVVPPNAQDYQPDDAASNPDEPQVQADTESASHAISAKGATSVDGRVRLADAAVGATYRVAVCADGHEDFQEEFACAGTNAETWEVVLRRIPDPLPSETGQDATEGAGTVRPLPSIGTQDSASGSGSTAGVSGQVQGQSDVVARPVSGFVNLLMDMFPYWLVPLALLVIALVAGCLWQARRIGKEEDRHDA